MEDKKDMKVHNHLDSEKVEVPDIRVEKIPFTKVGLQKASMQRISLITKEFERGFEFIQHYPRSVTFFGSARFKPDNEHYQKARNIAFALSKKGYAIVTGGGPGIMEAANYGALEAGGPSVGLNIEIPNEQVTNPYVTTSTNFYYFFTRKVVLSFSAEAYIFFPGGFGTLDEVTEMMTLVQTHKIPKVPIILVGSDFWKPFADFIKQEVFEKHQAIDEEHMNIYTITDSEEEAVALALNAPQR